MRTILFVTFALFFTSAAYAYPEFAGDGYFSCTSCHVSTSGGDLLTPYGRSVGEEKLTTWHYEGEGKPLHGLVNLPEWFLIGGHVRQIQVNYEDAQMKEGHYFKMQQEADLGVNFKNMWAYGTTSFERKEQNPYEFENSKPLVSKWLVRYDPLESLSVRVGRIYPKFGLNVPDHNAFVRQNIDLGAGRERKLAEATYCAETLEVNVSHTANFLPDTKLDALPEGVRKPEELYANLSAFVFGKHRASLAGFRRISEVGSLHVGSASGVWTATEAFRVSLEHQLGLDQKSNAITRLSNTYTKLWFKALPGLFPYMVYERQSRASDVEDGLSDRVGFGTSFHPRPHVELSGTLSTRRDLRKFTFGNSANFILHYWL